MLLLLLLLCSLQSEIDQLEEQVDQQAHKIQRYKVYREYMERVLEYSQEVIIIIIPCRGRLWQEETLVNLVIRYEFAKVLSTNCLEHPK